MFVYVVGYGTCEESEFEYLYHEEKFTKEEFEGMIHACALNAIRDMKEQDEYIHSYQSIHDETIAYLKNDYEFKSVEPELEWIVFGWASIFKHGDWNTYRTEPDNLTALIDRVIAAGYTVKDDSFLSWHEKE